MQIEQSAVRLWKRLSREDRHAASAAFWEQPAEAVVGSALGAIAVARRMRPQAVRSLSAEARTQALGAIRDPAEPLAASLLVALHMKERRALLSAFLDAAGLEHEDGILPEEAAPRITPETAQKAVRALAAFPPEQVAMYLNTLWLQDPEYWDALPQVEIPAP